MSCCVDREGFILGKVRNMHAWLKPWITEELAALYDETKMIGLIATGLLPLYASGKLDDAVGEVMTRLQGVSAAEIPAVRVKVRRYLDCFCEAMV